MSCPEVRSLLALRSFAELEDDEEKLVRTHLPACAACRTEAEDYDAVLAVLHEGREGAVQGEKREPATSPARREELWKGVLADLDKPRATTAGSERGEHEGEGATGADVSIALSCSFCHDTLPRAEICYCASCLAPHHEDCWQTHGRCSAPGCEETLTVRPRGDEQPVRIARPRRFGRFALGLALLAAGGGAGAVAARSQARRAAEQAAIAQQLARASEKPSETAKAEPPKPESPKPESPKKADPPAKMKEINLAFEDADLADVVASISSMAGEPIFLAPDIHEKVTISLRSIPWRDALDVIARMQKCEVGPFGEGSLLVDQPREVTLHFDRVDVRTALRELAKQSGANIIVSHGCGSLASSPDFIQVPWLKALRSILKTYGVHAVLQGSIIVVLPGPGPDLPEDAGSAPPHHIVGVSSPKSVETPPLSGRRGIDLAVEKVDLRDACDELGRQVGRNIIVEPDIKETVTLSVTNAPWEDVALALALQGHCALEQRGRIYVLTQPAKIDLRAKDAPAAEWFKLLAMACGNNIVASGAIEGRVSCDLHAVEWLDALKASCVAEGFELHEDDGGIFRVTAPARPAEMPRGRGQEQK